MALPDRVQQQLEQAEALLVQLNQPPQERLEQAAEPVVSVGEAPVVPPVVVAPPAPKPVDEWEHRFKSLDGIVRSRDARIAQLAAELERTQGELQRAAAESQRAATPEVDPSKDVEMFGADLVEMVKRMTQQMLESAAGSFDERFKLLEQRLEGTAGAVARNEEETFFTKLAKRVPEWETINANPAFLAWLSEEDPVYGEPRQSALNRAQQSQDVTRVARVFQAFTEGQAPVAAAVPKPNPLARQAVPRAAASTAPAAPEVRVITQAYVQAFYKDVAQGKYRGNEARAQQMEAEINAAMAEGRIK